MQKKQDKKTLELQLQAQSKFGCMNEFDDAYAGQQSDLYKSDAVFKPADFSDDSPKLSRNAAVS